MKYVATVFLALILSSCARTVSDTKEVKIVLMHHSTGQFVWNGSNLTLPTKIYNKITDNKKLTLGKTGSVKRLFDRYNRTKNTNYCIEDKIFPKKEGYGWRNYPYDYYNIWVENAGDSLYKGEPTLEMLTKEYDVIVWKHCFPGSAIKEDNNNADIRSEEKKLENYKLQYESLKTKMKEFKNKKFIVWTIPALIESSTNAEDAGRALEFSKWVINTWDGPNDNIFIWDFRTIETNGGLFLPDNLSISEGDSHPNNTITRKASKLLVNRIIDVIENNGMKTDILGNPN